MKKGEDYQILDIPLNGKLTIEDDPAKNGQSDFSVLKNYRYTDKGIKGISGMTKITTAAPTGLGFTHTLLSGHFYQKQYPAEENHVLAHTSYSTASRAIFITDESASIPSQDTISYLGACTTGTTNADFCNAPDGDLIICDEGTDWVWSGHEARLPKAIKDTVSLTSTSRATSYAVDVTDKLSKTSTSEVVTISVDSDTMLLYHFDGTDASTTITDSSGRGHTGTCQGNAQLDTAYYKFGTASLLLDGTGDYVTLADSADFDLSSGYWTIEFQLKFNSFPASGSIQTIYRQNTDANNYFHIYAEGTTVLGAAYTSIRLAVYSSGVQTIYVSNGAYNATTSTLGKSPWGSSFHHIAFQRVSFTGLSYYTAAYDGISTAVADTDVAANYTGTIYIGGDGSTFVNGWIDEFRISKIARYVYGGYVPPTSAFSATSYPVLFIGAARELSSVKVYVYSGNTETATITAYAWSGSSWSSIAGITDNTSGFSTTGTITGLNGADPKPAWMFDSYLYWYELVLSNGEAQIYAVTVCNQYQKLTDLWDGTYRNCLYCYKEATTGVYQDNSLSTLASDFLTASDTYTFLDISSLTSSQYIYCGFNEPLAGLYVVIPKTYGNTNSSTLTVSYWNGQAWTAINGVTDGTTATGTLGRSGIISWPYDSSSAEHQKYIISGTSPMYYYRLSVGSTLSASTYIDMIAGISAPKDLVPHKFGITYQNRLLLCNETYGQRNKVTMGFPNTTSIWNGSQVMDFYLGDSSELMCGEVLFTRFGSNIYESAVFFKRNAIFLLDGTDITNYKVYTISTTVGCVAPKTLKRCDIDFEVAQGLTRHVLIFQSDSGIHAFDGNNVSRISDDIDDYFDPTSSNYINTSVMENFAGFYDPTRGEYHWIFATGSNTSMHKELVYNLKLKKWSEIVRGTNYIKAGITVRDPYGRAHCYGVTGSYLMRLENGTDWDTEDIAYTFRLCDPPLSKSMWTESQVRHVKLTGLAKTTTSAKVSLNWYLDGSSTAMTPTPETKSQSTSNRYYKARWSLANAQGITHAPEVSISTDNETIGIEPLFLSYLYRIKRIDF